MSSKRDSTYYFKLVHKDLGFEIDTNDLSTGEKTLMSLALAIYNTTGQGGQADILILDEPDAPLHPSLSKLMLELLEEDVVKKYGIPVIMSTHSPTTITSAPPRQCDLEDSISTLTYGIANLHISVEKRRQVFVEHSYDVEYYEALYEILSRHYQFDTLPQFLPPHSRNGTNCSDVKSITRTLRDLGNTQVYGLIDWDGENRQEDQIIILGLEKRYSIENYILEPHLLGLYLVKKNFVSPVEIGLPNCSSYLDICNKISNETLQCITNIIESKISWDNTDSSSRISSILINDYTLQVRQELYTIKGHNLEEKCKTAWPRLNSVRGNGDSALKKDIVFTIINDFPLLLSKDIIDTFMQFK